MSNKQCKNNKFRKLPNDKFECNKCSQTSDKKDKVCKPEKNKLKKTGQKVHA